MRRHHIAYLTFPHASHVNSSFSVVSTLAKRGYRVSYVSSERFLQKVAGLGIETLTCPVLPKYIVQPEVLGDSQEHPFITLASATLANVLPFYEENRPDLIAYDDLCLAGRLTAELLRVPSVRMSPCLALSVEGLSRQLKSVPHRDTVLAVEAEVARFLETFGGSGHFFFHNEGFNVYSYPKVFQLEDDIASANSLYAGRCAGEQRIRGVWQPKNTGERPVLLVSTSTFYLRGPDYFKMCVDALRDLRWHVVLAIGDNNDPRMFDALPPHFEILQGVPQFEALRYVDLLIALGGTATTMEAMYYGIPLLLITDGHPEPELYADNVVRLGLGRHLRKGEVTAETVRSSVIQISGDEDLLRRVRQMQLVVQREPGGEETVNRMIEYLNASRS
jgi:MGT family glycosyltransferase